MCPVTHSPTGGGSIESMAYHTPLLSLPASKEEGEQLTPCQSAQLRQAITDPCENPASITTTGALATAGVPTVAAAAGTAGVLPNRWCCPFPLPAAAPTALSPAKSGWNLLNSLPAAREDGSERPPCHPCGHEDVWQLLLLLWLLVWQVNDQAPLGGEGPE